MIFNVYSIYDPETESFETSLRLAPLSPDDMGEQFRRSFIVADEKAKAFMQGKKAVYLGTFDDETGRINQKENLLTIFEFKGKEIKKIDGEKENKEECQEPSQSITEQKDLN